MKKNFYKRTLSGIVVGLFSTLLAAEAQRAGGGGGGGFGGFGGGGGSFSFRSGG